MGRSRFVYDLLMKFYKPSRIWERISPFRKNDSERNTSAHLIPVYMVLSGGENVVLPLAIIEIMLGKTDTIGIMAECLCRRGEGCVHHPADIGCLILGDAARDLDPRLGRLVTREEATAHAHGAVARGLYPMVVHNEFDAWLWGIDYRRMMNICFCCDCCCSVRKSVRLRRSEGFFRNIHRLPGLTVYITESCDGCGKCAEACMAGAVRIDSGKAVIDLNDCKGCGRCAQVCPRGAVVLKMDGAVDCREELLGIYRKRAGLL